MYEEKSIEENEEELGTKNKLPQEDCTEDQMELHQRCPTVLDRRNSKESSVKEEEKEENSC